MPLCPEDEKLQMRKWVINSVLESEKTYLGMLDILMQVSVYLYLVFSTVVSLLILSYRVMYQLKMKYR